MSFASFVLSLRNVLGVPSTKIPIDGSTFISHILPPFVCQFAVAVLALKPQTRAIRVALWPLVALLAFRAAVFVDMSLGKPEQEFNNTNFVLFMLAVAVRTLDWALAKGPLVRHLRPTNSSPSVIMDALDLICNFRGHGWEWSCYRSYIPPETRPSNRMAFVLHALFSAVGHALVCGAFHRAVIMLVTAEVGSVSKGPTIFDETLPFPLQYIKATMISLFFAIDIYATMHMAYDASSLLGILVLGQDPAQWPPPFNAPWRATSLSDLWGHRWHQFLRHTFLVLGGYPLSVVFGRPGRIFGTFLGSIVWHHITLLTLDIRVEMWWMLLGFGMMGLGILAERTFYQLTGKRVDGVSGWVWTMLWFMLWGNMIVEGFTRVGMFVCSSPLDSESPLRAPVERLVAGFDLWLHTI